MGLYLLENGCAWVYPQYIDSVEPDWQDAYVIAERAARREGIGLWENIDPTPPWTWRKEKRERQAVAEEAVRPTDEQALTRTRRKCRRSFQNSQTQCATPLVVTRTTTERGSIVSPPGGSSFRTWARF